MNRRERYRSPEYLDFAHQQPANCSVCRWVHGEFVPAEELHHFGEKGMGQRSDDTWVTPVCMRHHKYFQGKRFLGFVRENEYEVLAAMERGCIELLAAYVEHLESSR